MVLLRVTRFFVVVVCFVFVNSFALGHVLLQRRPYILVWDQDSQVGVFLIND